MLSPGMTDNSTFSERSQPGEVGEPQGCCAHTVGITEIRAGRAPEFSFHPTPQTRQEGRDGARFTRGSPGPSPEQASLNACTHGEPTRAHAQEAQQGEDLGLARPQRALAVQPGPQHGVLNRQSGALIWPHVPRGKCVAVHTAEGSRGPSLS